MVCQRFDLRARLYRNDGIAPKRRAGSNQEKNDAASHRLLQTDSNDWARSRDRVVSIEEFQGD
jgi:hypothetical protein